MFCRGLTLPPLARRLRGSQEAARLAFPFLLPLTPRYHPVAPLMLGVVQATIRQLQQVIQ